MSMGRLLESLLNAKKIPPQAFSAINDILPVCNEAVHGGEIDPNVAQSVLAIGSDVLALLQRARLYSASTS
jgi:hypothetical protein